MSEQPQEWTPSMVFEMMGSDHGEDGWDGWDCERRVAAAHNAAVAVHRQAVLDAMSLSNEMCEKLEKQLTAERKRAERWRWAAERENKRHAAALQQLAAERALAKVKKGK
jgi:hypothetical protein